LNIIFFLLNIVLVIALLIGYTSVYISPDIIYIPAFFGLAYPFLLFANVLILLWWLFQLHLKFLMSLGVVVMGWNFIGRTIEYHKDKIPGDESIKVMSYNVMNFGFEKNQNSREDILSLILEEQPDILCLQEFYANSKWPVDVEKKIASILHTKYYYFNNLNGSNKDFKIGTVIYSRFPIKNKGTVPYDMATGNSTIYVDIDFKGTDIRVYNVHLQSIRFQGQDYALLNAFGNNTDKTIQESKSILSKMKQAYILRAEQASKVHTSISNSPYKVLVLGDFNDAPVSYTYNKICGGLHDAFVESGNGFGRTYAGAFPSFRIDYILGSPAFEFQNFKVGDKKFSDHYHITAIAQLKESEK